MLRIKTIIFLLILSVFSASAVQAQLCGQSFARFTVSDTTGKSVSNITIELLAELSEKSYKELWGKYGNKEAGFQPNPFKIPSSVAKDIIEQSPPLSITEDYCGNPLKQRAGKTKVKTLNDREASEKNFGFCMTEGGYGSRYLLKISTPNYVTDYYIGDYLGGCNQSWGFVLTKNSKKSKE